MRMIVIGLMVVGLAGPALACSCADQTREEAIANADAVFSGTVESVEKDGFWNLATLKVHDVTKGTVDEEAKVSTSRDGASCGVHFEVGQKIELAAIQRKDRLHVSSCGQMGLGN